MWVISEYLFLSELLSSLRIFTAKLVVKDYPSPTLQEKWLQVTMPPVGMEVEKV